MSIVMRAYDPIPPEYTWDWDIQVRGWNEVEENDNFSIKGQWSDGIIINGATTIINGATTIINGVTTIINGATTIINGATTRNCNLWMCNASPPHWAPFVEGKASKPAPRAWSLANHEWLLLRELQPERIGTS